MDARRIDHATVVPSVGPIAATFRRGSPNLFAEVASLSFPDQTDADRVLLDRLIRRVLLGERWCDGLDSYRVVERSPSRVRICGRVWHIEQVLHTFWLDVESDDRWTLHCMISSPMNTRQARYAADTMQDPSEVSWRLRLGG